ncbi:MAG: fumarylacetoacetate hydrolase family protein [Bacteroidetes bacterium]|nr:fumarylacetoacetate hydrolase family protein [Bacteroidota bacterium]
MKVIAVARNYVDHAKELNNPVPTEPVLFMKPPNAVLKDNKPFYHPEFSNNIHYEGEIVLHICKNGKHIKEKFAPDYFDAITVGIDLTARDLQQKQKEKGLPWEISKSFDRSAVVGEFIPKSEFNDLYKINFSLKKNGEIVQQGNTSDLIFKFEHLIAYSSIYFTFNIADLFYTGTPKGVGKITQGDVFEGFIETRKVLQCEIM